jgi:hypothetical protein
MRLSLITIFALALTACQTVPTKRTFPSLPPAISTPCPNLEIHPNTPEFSEHVKVIVSNYGKYHECAIEVEQFLKWHAEQKENFESVDKTAN